jgi:hypothetical protein
MAFVLKWMPVCGLLLESNQVSLYIKCDILRTNIYKVMKSKHAITGTTDHYQPALITLFYFNLCICFRIRVLF